MLNVRPSLLIMRIRALPLLLLVASISFADQEDYSSGISDRIHINGEAGVAFFDTGREGDFPNEEFRVDEAKLFIEAVIIDDVYVFVEANVLTREEDNEIFEIGELYLEFEDIGKKARLFNVRVGRFDIPFGEEYLTRDAIDNPLISHSLSDIWGVDEGVQLFGSRHQFEYVIAIQNGGAPVLQDFNSDKSIAARMLYRPAANFHVSVSAMRTGDLDVDGDRFSEVWFGNGFLVPLGSLNATTVISGNIFQGDGHLSWKRGHLHVAGGQLQYRDDNIARNYSRNANYFYVEGVQHLTASSESPWYAAARFSRIDADNGFPLVGFGDFQTFLFDDERLTEELWRMSLGIGYRIRRNLLLKAEYSLENGRQVDGADRDNENFVGIEAAVRF